MFKQRQHNQGSFLPLILSIGAAGIILLGVVVGLAVYNLQSGAYFAKRATSLQIAEAGINYYQWHLAHDKKDYRDGQNWPENPPYGPYVHDYKNAIGEVMGQFTLTIVPPEQNSNAVTVTSVGKATNSSKEITIEAKLGIPSFSQYAWVVNDQLYFGSGATTNGKVHSNNGVRFDGTANDLIMSAKEIYGYGCTSTVEKPGVWTSGTGVFNKGYQFPVPYVDFTQITADLQNIKTESEKPEGIYLPNSNALGYYLKFNSNPNTIDVSRVTVSNQNRIRYTFYQSFSYPQNGIIYVEDDVYTSGIVNGKLTLAAATLPDPGNSDDRRSLTIVDDLVYYNGTYDGSIVLGLIAQQDINVARFVPANLTIDGALLAQNGGIGLKFSSFFNGHDLGTLITHGGLASDLGVCTGYGMARFNSRGDIEGFSTRIYNYDPALFFDPPPMFPTTGTFTILTWRQK